MEQVLHQRVGKCLAGGNKRCEGVADDVTPPLRCVEVAGFSVVGKAYGGLVECCLEALSDGVGVVVAVDAVALGGAQVG